MTRPFGSWDADGGYQQQIQLYNNHRMIMTDQQQQITTATPPLNMADQSVPGQSPKISAPQGVAGAPNEAVLLQLMERTGYTMLQENGQRKYGGPPPCWDAPAPLRGCEIFVGKIPRDCYEDELVPVFEKVGRIYELRLMMDFSGSNRGYCFVMYSNKDEARRAVKELNNFEIRKGRFLGVCLSVDNCRLFVGGIPKNKQREEILSEMVKVTEGVVDVIVYPSATDKSKNRGFAFVEFESHKAAAMARRKLIPGRIQLWGQQIAVDWAEPEQEVDDDTMSKVKILYVRNLMLSTTEDTLREIFTKAVDKNNSVERVKKIRDYAFIHFREREDAIDAMHALNGKHIDNSLVEVCLAKPVDKSEYQRFSRGGRGGGVNGAVCTDAELKTGEALLEGYGGLGYADQAAAYPYYQQLALANPAATLGGRGYGGRPQMAQLSPGGHMGGGGGGGNPRGRGRGAAGMRGAGNRSYLSGVRNNNYRKRPDGEPRLYEMTPDMVLTPTNPLTLKPQALTSHVQVLEDICQKNGWGQPLYQLNSAISHDGNNDMQLFLYKVNVPALPGLQQPQKLCRTMDEAKQYAAENVLRQLNVPVDAGGDGGMAALANGQHHAYSQLATTHSRAAAAAAAAAAAGVPSTTLYPMSNGALTPTTVSSHYPSTALTSVPTATFSSPYMVSPQKMTAAGHTAAAAALTQPNGHGDVASDMSAFNFASLAATMPAVPPMAYAQYHC